MEKYIFDKEKLPVPILNGHDDWMRTYYRAWELAFSNVDYIEKEGWKPQLTCMPGVNVIWQWDSCIMTFITNYSNGSISAFTNLDNLYRLRRESDGFMAMAYTIDTEEEAYPGRINPPLMAWAEWEHFLISGDSSRFLKVLPALEGCFSFIENNRRRSCGLYWFEDSGSSGMDNSPRSGYVSETLSGSDVCFVDLACQQAMSAKYIGLMYKKLGNMQKAEFYASEHERICELINKYHWCEKTGFYYDFFARHAKELKVKFINTKTAAVFWTLISGVATGERRKSVIEHMFNTEEFYTLIPFATLSKDDLNYDSTGGYWLGGVWAPTNFAAIRGLADSGYQKLARESAIKYLDAICKVSENPEYDSIWEAYAPESYKPSTCEDGDLCRKNFVGWSGIAPITMLIENIIGIRLNADNNTIYFSVPNEPLGVKNMDFNSGKVSLVCEEYEAAEKKTKIKAIVEKPVILSVKTDYLQAPVIFELEAGEHSLFV